MTYGSAHRFFLRTVASQGVLTTVDAQKALDKFTGEEQLPVQDVVKAINDEIRPYQQEIKITKDEATNEDVIVFLSLGYDDATKSQNLFSATELEYFRILLEQIMTTESRQITGIHAINLVSKMKSSFTKTDAQKLLNTWVRMRYLDKEENNYALGVRAIHEFEGYIQQNMPDTIDKCCLCKQSVFRGYNCPACALAVHTWCLMRYVEKVDKWPCCKVVYNHEQLEQLTNQGSRLTQTQVFDNTHHSEEHANITQQDSSEDIDQTQGVTQETTQRTSRKRKQQNDLSQTQPLETTHNSVEYDTIVEPTQHQESTEDVDLTQEVTQDTTQRVTKKRKQQNELIIHSQLLDDTRNSEEAASNQQDSSEDADLTQETSQRVTRKRKLQNDSRLNSEAHSTATQLSQKKEMDLSPEAKHRGLRKRKRP